MASSVGSHNSDCSTEDKVSCHTIYPHKTGGYIQVVSKEQSENLNRLDRRGVGSIKTAKHYKEFKVDEVDRPKPIKFRKCNKVYTSYGYLNINKLCDDDLIDLRMYDANHINIGKMNKEFIPIMKVNDNFKKG